MLSYYILTLPVQACSLNRNVGFNRGRLNQRGSDGKEIFTIRKKRHAEYWLAQAYPVMLVIRTSDDQIRWMNVTDYWKRHEGKDTKQIVFAGEPFTALNVARLRDKLFR